MFGINAIVSILLLFNQTDQCFPISFLATVSAMEHDKIFTLANGLKQQSYGVRFRTQTF